MEVPEQVYSINCYRAMRALLRAVERDEQIGRDVFCPGLATGVGMVPAVAAAAKMADACKDWKKGTQQITG